MVNINHEQLVDETIRKYQGSLVFVFSSQVQNGCFVKRKPLRFLKTNNAPTGGALFRLAYL
jgi:hypothetical protein